MATYIMWDKHTCLLTLLPKTLLIKITVSEKENKSTLHKSILQMNKHQLHEKRTLNASLFSINQNQLQRYSVTTLHINLF